MPELIEVKCEDRYAASGNICIELYQGKAQRRASGISVSESTAFVHTLGDNAAVYRTQEMRLFLKSAAGLHVALFAGSDNGNEGIILPITSVRGESWFAVCLLDDLPHSLVFAKPGLARLG